MKLYDRTHVLVMVRPECEGVQKMFWTEIEGKNKSRGEGVAVIVSALKSPGYDPEQDAAEKLREYCRKNGLKPRVET